MDNAVGYQKDTLTQIVEKVAVVKTALEAMHRAFEKAHHAADLHEEAHLLCNEVKPQMEIIRDAVDTLEGLVDDQYWPLVKYREMLFVR